VEALGPEASIWREGIKLEIHLLFLSFPWQIHERKLGLQGIGDEKGSLARVAFSLGEKEDTFHHQVPLS
jgi:hypothetical protein